MSRRSKVVALVALVGILVVGVVGAVLFRVESPFGREPGSAGLSRAEARVELQGRPDVESELAALQTMLATARERMSTELGVGEWVQDSEIGGAGCGQGFEGMGGQTLYTERWLLSGGIPEASWPGALAIMSEESARLGFDTVRTFVDQPGDHTVAIFGADGANLSFGTRRNATMYASTGCRPPAAGLLPE